MEASNNRIEELPPIDLKSEFDIVKIDSNTYETIKPLAKPKKRSRGAFGGNIAASAVAVAIRSSPEGFVPNALHSFFIKAVTDEIPITWKIEDISVGRTFVNKFIKGYQYDKIVYTANVSLTSKNSTSKTSHRNSSKINYSIPLKGELDISIYEAPIVYKFESLFAYQKHSSYHSETISASYILSFGIAKDSKIHQPLTNHEITEFKYAGVTTLTDWITLELLLPKLNIDVKARLQTSIDHNVYYHDDDFKLDQYFIYNLQLKWIGHNRAVIKGDIYTEDKKQIISIVQERLFVTTKL
ncbi:uncharacterized protein KGF55_001746 [Candida pseudojiufengensis]|uniref:uncharacterized protein n=1 Tax=Candida pseudojiufengensis TaxID=497109 RepID=UPI00222430FF|nr:uncharacterized protein KGF55_001746 [Candida pseudojiufengensis]KAI5964677.1 hypothetical protein KGF55_001746 [Candida pseudojiufengensis]